MGTPLRIIFSFFMIFTLGCSASARDTPPPQGDLDAVIRLLIDEAERISQALQNFESCAEFEAAVANLPENISCLKGGSLTTSVSDVMCEEGPPVMAALMAMLVSNRCTIDSRASSGSLNNDYTVIGNEEVDVMAGDNLVIEAIELNFTDLTVQLANGVAFECSGRLRMFRDNFCNMAADCSGCPLE